MKGPPVWPRQVDPTVLGPRAALGCHSLAAAGKHNWHWPPVSRIFSAVVGLSCQALHPKCFDKWPYPPANQPAPLYFSAMLQKACRFRASTCTSHLLFPPHTILTSFSHSNLDQSLRTGLAVPEHPLSCVRLRLHLVRLVLLRQYGRSIADDENAHGRPSSITRRTRHIAESQGRRDAGTGTSQPREKAERMANTSSIGKSAFPFSVRTQSPARHALPVLGYINHVASLYHDDDKTIFFSTPNRP